MNIISTLVIMAFVSFFLTGCEEGNASKTNNVVEEEGVMNILRHSDYLALTHCEVSHYPDSVMTAIDALILNKADDMQIDYARRHSLPLFESIATDGYISSNCLPNSLRVLGEKMALLARGKENIDTSTHKITYYDPANEGPDDGALAFQVMSRTIYMEKTECLVSPSSYEKYRRAVSLFINDKVISPERSAKVLGEFFEDLKASRPTEDGDVSPKCLTQGLRFMGTELGLLPS